MRSSSHELVPCSADFQSAVSPISNRQGVRSPAGYKPAIRQTTSLRYGFLVPKRDPKIVGTLHEHENAILHFQRLTHFRVHGPNARPLGLEAFHEPDGGAALLRSRSSVDGATQQRRPTISGFMSRAHGSETKQASPELGRDAFHRVPGICFSRWIKEIRDGVEFVPTKFRVPMRADSCMIAPDSRGDHHAPWF
jgi:hypothetical protein